MRLRPRLPSEALRSPQRPSAALRGHQRPSEALRGHQRPSEAIRGHQRPSEIISGHQRHPFTCRDWASSAARLLATALRWSRNAVPRSSPATRRAIDSCGEKEELGRRGEPLHAALPALSAGAYRREARGDQGRSMDIKGDRTCAKPEAITTAPTPDSAAWSAASTWGRWDGAVVSTCMQGREVSTRGLFSASRRRGEHMHARLGGPHARPLLRLAHIVLKRLG